MRISTLLVCMTIVTAASCRQLPQPDVESARETAVDVRPEMEAAREVNDSVHYYYEKAIEAGKRQNDLRALSMAYNALAIYTSEMEMNYLKGISCFTQALGYAEKSGDYRLHAAIMNNLAMEYYLRNDPAGLEYSLRVYRTGMEKGDSMLVYCGSFVTAYMYYLLGDGRKALSYMEKALAFGGESTEYAEAYSLYATLLAETGDETAAARFYKKALDNIGSENSNTLAYISYGKFLLERGRAGEAIEVLENGLKYADTRNNAFYRYRLYRELSEAYGATGNLQTALDYYKAYHAEADSIFNVERERSINELRARYEYEKQEKEISEKNVLLLRERSRLQLTLFGAAVLALGTAVLSVGYYRKNLRYRQIVRQQHELVLREKQLGILREREKNETETKYSASALSDEKGDALFAHAEKYMQSERPYRDKDITIEKIADALGTNRTYLSRTINEHAGMSFPQYISSYRINEARRILSDPSDDIQIKTLAYELGFSKPENFSAVFKKAIGMLPSKFREETRKLYRPAQKDEP